MPAQTIITRDLITSALREINVIAADENPSAQDAAWGLEKLQRMVDGINARRALIYNVNFLRFTLLNKSPITIGPGGDFNVPARPVVIESWELVLGAGATEVDIPHRKVRDNDWWAANPTKALSATIPSDLYYSPDFPLGNLYFWPKPSVANDVRLETWVNLTQPLTLQTSLGLPPGYWNFLVYTLAVELCASFEKQPSPALVASQRMYMQTVEENNDKPPLIETASGFPNSQRTGRPDFNWITGLPE